MIKILHEIFPEYMECLAIIREVRKPYFKFIDDIDKTKKGIE
jgi:hypothetical protein